MALSTGHLYVSSTLSIDVNLLESFHLPACELVGLYWRLHKINDSSNRLSCRRAAFIAVHPPSLQTPEHIGRFIWEFRFMDVNMTNMKLIHSQESSLSSNKYALEHFELIPLIFLGIKCYVHLTCNHLWS